MSKTEKEIEVLVEQILDDETESGVQNPLSRQFLSVVSQLQEETKATREREKREGWGRRITHLLLNCPELTIREGTVASLEQMLKDGNPYGGEITLRTLFNGQDAAEEVLRDRITQVRNAAQFGALRGTNPREMLIQNPAPAVGEPVRAFGWAQLPDAPAEF